jgi:hypothetical protein
VPRSFTIDSDIQERLDLIAVACWADTAIAERAPGFNAAFIRLGIKRRDTVTDRLTLNRQTDT